MKITVVGDSGLLGQSFVKTALKNGHAVCGISTSPVSVSKARASRYTHHVLDLRTQWKKTEEITGSFKPDLLLNAAAYASIPFCEGHPAEANYLNVEVPARLALTANICGAYYIHISSDQVFDGVAREPYREDAPTRPINGYGRTKRESELAVLAKNPGALVVRTNIVGLKNRGTHTFAEWLVHSFKSRSPITLFTNYVTSSIHVDLLSEVLLRCFKRRLSGLFHIVSADHASKYDFGRKLAEKLGLDFSFVTGAAMESRSMTPPRPEFLALCTAKIENELGIVMPLMEKTLDLLASPSAVIVEEQGK